MKKIISLSVSFLFVTLLALSPMGCQMPNSDCCDDASSCGSTEKQGVISSQCDDVPFEKDDTRKNYSAILQDYIQLDGKMVLVDLGSDSCAPCIQMEPIIEELQNDYSNDFTTLFIPVHKDRQAAADFGVQFIPTQILLDAQGNELSRHVGFFSKEEILDLLAENGCSLSNR